MAFNIVHSQGRAELGPELSEAYTDVSFQRTLDNQRLDADDRKRMSDSKVLTAMPTFVSSLPRGPRMLFPRQPPLS